MSEQLMTDDIIPHGEEIVERFGGIRPMAAKLNVPVTTVQGWKKRDAIPAIRRDEILSAAALHDIDLKGLLSDAANENTAARARSSIAEDPALMQSQRPAQPATQAAAAKPASTQTPTIEIVDMRQIKSAARTTSIITTVSILALVGGAAYVLFGPATMPSRDQVTSLENRLSVIESTNSEGASGDTGIIQQSLGKLQQRVDDITTAIGSSADELAQLARAAATGGGATLIQRLTSLEQQLLSANGAGASAPALARAMDRMQTLAQSPQGAAQWQSAIEELRTIVTGLQGRTDGLESALTQARTENDALGRTLGDLSGRDLGAAAMLLALTQLRQSAEREAPFTEDLALLRQVAAGTDPELGQSIDRLAPYAETGVLSPAGLKRELLASANDIVTAKMRGEDVSVKDKVMGRLQGLFSVSKDGVPMGGSGDEQALIQQASAQLDRGDVAGAMATLNQLQGPAAEAAKPWQTKADASMAAQQLDMQLVQRLMSKVKSGLQGVAGGASGPINLAPAQPQVAPATEEPVLAPVPGSQ